MMLRILERKNFVEEAKARGLDPVYFAVDNTPFQVREGIQAVRSTVLLTAELKGVVFQYAEHIGDYLAVSEPEHKENSEKIKKATEELKKLLKDSGITIKPGVWTPA